MGLTYSVTLPLPTKKLSGNYRGHTRGKGFDVAAYRAACDRIFRRSNLPVFAVKRKGKEQPPRVRIDLDYYLAPVLDANGKVIPDDIYRPQDEDSGRTAFKPGQDALQDAKLIPSDSSIYVECGSTRLRRSRAEHGGARKLVVTFTIEKLPTAEAIAAAKERGELKRQDVTDARARVAVTLAKQAKRATRRFR